MEPQAKREVEEAVHEAIAHFGLAGTVVLEGKLLELRGKGLPTAIDVELIGEQWPLLPPELRRRKVQDIARRLAEAHRAANSSVLAGDPGATGQWVGRVVIAVLALAAVYGGVRFYVKTKTPPPAAPAVVVETKGQETERLGRVCEAVRRRIYQGAHVGPFEMGGWAVELWLSGRFGVKLRESPALSMAVKGDKLTPNADDELARITDGSVAIVDGFSAENGAKSAGWQGTTVLFTGGYARAFFEADKRARFVSLAGRLADGTGADIAGLYARCVHLEKHDIGVWFRGQDMAGASVALLYSMGLFADAPAVDRAAILGLGGGKGELDALIGAAGKAGAGPLGAIMTTQGAGIQTAATSVTVTFPLNGPTRATTASRSVARKLGVGIGSGTD